MKARLLLELSFRDPQSEDQSLATLLRESFPIKKGFGSDFVGTLSGFDSIRNSSNLEQKHPIPGQHADSQNKNLTNLALRSDLLI